MKRIIIMVHSASHEIYQRNVKALFDGYIDMINKDGLPIDVFAYCGTCKNPNHKYIEGTISRFDEKEVNNVFFDVMSSIVDLEKYDVIVKTNTNTVVNLPMLYAFCSSIYFDPNILYTNICFFIDDYDGRNLTFPSGMFIMADRKIWKKMIENKDNTIEHINRVESISPHSGIKHDESESAERLIWTGYSDEFTVGVDLRLLNIPISVLRSSTVSHWKADFFRGCIDADIFSDKVLDNFLTINCKLDMDSEFKFGSMEEKFRLHYEPIFISTICKLMCTHNPTFNEVANLETAYHETF